MPDVERPASTLLSLSTARSAGLTSAQWRDPELVRITRGVKASCELDGFAERCRAFALVLPADAVFSHLTAARLWGLPLPSWACAVDDLDVMRPTKRPVVERAGCRGHRGLDRREAAVVAGLPVTGLADTWVDLAEVRSPQALTADDLTVAADAVLMRWAESIDVRPGEEEWQAAARLDMERRDGGPRPDRRDRLHAVLDQRVRQRGATRLRAGLARARVGSRSPMESRVRLLLDTRGFPEPELNATVVGPGGWILEGDLVWRERRVIAEYQGEHHGGRRQRSVDVARRSLAEDDGWQVVEIWAEDVYGRLRRRTLLRRLADKLGLDLSLVDLT